MHAVGTLVARDGIWGAPFMASRLLSPGARSSSQC